MADIATETREAVANPQKKEIEKKVEDKVEEPKVAEPKVAENGKDEKDLPKENGTNGNIKESEEAKDSEITENSDSTDSTEATKAVKRKSDAAAGDAPESTPEEVGASPEKKAKLEEKPVENGEAEAAVA